MNKDFIISIQDKFYQLIKSGLKKYEFRMGNFKNIKKGQVGHIYVGKDTKLVVAKFVVGEVILLPTNCHEDTDCECPYNQDGDCGASEKHFDIMQNPGYTDQKYAIEITNFEMYDTPKRITEFVSYSKYQKMLKNAIQSCHKLPYCEKFNNFDCMTCETLYEDNNLYLTRPPQSFCYVVGDE